MRFGEMIIHATWWGGLELRFLHIDIFHDIPIQRNRRFSDLQDMGRVSLMHPDDAPWNDAEIAQAVKPLV